MGRQIRSFRQQVEVLFGGLPRPGSRYPEALKALAVEVALREVAGGQRLGIVARELGVGVGTLQRWVEARPREAGALRPVEVVSDGEAAREPSDPGGLILVTAAGHRVEGLVLAEVALLLESLG